MLLNVQCLNLFVYFKNKMSFCTDLSAFELLKCSALINKTENIHEPKCP